METMKAISNAIGAMSAKLGALIDARNVLRPNGKTKRTFQGRIVGAFQRTGPNPWDGYRFVDKDGEPIDVMPGIRIQAEPAGQRFRMRAHGAVVMVQWNPTDEERSGFGEDTDLQKAFVETCIEPFQNKAGIGAAAFIAKTLGR